MTKPSIALLAAALVVAACGGGATGGADASVAPSASDASDRSDASDASEPVRPDAGALDGGADLGFSIHPCTADAPPGAALPPPLPAYEGTCPVLVPAPAFNSIESSGAVRRFMVVVPRDLDPGQRLPVLFMWHWLGGSPVDFLNRGEVQLAVDTLRFIAVIPESKTEVVPSAPFKWPFEITAKPERMEEEFRFFEDMLACVAGQFRVSPTCVGSTGMSAGALFTAQLASFRGDRLSSIVSLSGGVGAGVIKPWGHPAHKMPALVLWGGPQDFCIAVQFQVASQELEQGLAVDGHFLTECIHNCKHDIPPIDPIAGKSRFAGLWQFVFDHPYWLTPGDSPYLTAGLNPDLPEWCGIGEGSATVRDGVCPAKDACQ